MIHSQMMEVNQLVEKPSVDLAPSHFAIPGRYVLSPKIFQYLRKTQPGAGGEIQLTDALQLLATEERLIAYQFEGMRYDTGDRLGMIDATLAFALKRPELKSGVLELLRKYSEAAPR